MGVLCSGDYGGGGGGGAGAGAGEGLAVQWGLWLCSQAQGAATFRIS